ncbi:MAG TPA: MmcQ/YjbR family DNA-binding protein [Casimicrobiaceae bacterium]|nr:MmcQ/YjbR family DNA-binding protein [Casimicrobiaceae bacterium]
MPESFSALRRFAGTLPGATVDIKWGADECYCIGGKMFAVFGIENGKERGMSIKVDPERFLELTDIDGIVPAPYLARARWVKFERPNALPAAEARALIERSHALIAAKLTRRERASALGIKPT